MAACYNADCFRPTETDLKLPDRQVNSEARIGSDWQGPSLEIALPVELKSFVRNDYNAGAKHRSRIESL